MSCAMVAPVTERIAEDDPRLTASRMPMELAGEVLMDVISSAGLMQQAEAHQQPQSEIDRYRETARQQFEIYLDLMAEAGREAGRLKP